MNELHDYLVREQGVEMLMWSDRFLDAKTTGYGRWEASDTGSHRAIDRVPKDIIMCDWHYEMPAVYQRMGQTDTVSLGKVFPGKGLPRTTGAVEESGVGHGVPASRKTRRRPIRCSASCLLAGRSTQTVC